MLNLRALEWHNIKSFIGIGKYIKVCEVTLHIDDDEENTKTAEAIIKAVQMTYGKNIDPKFVPIMFRYLRGIIEQCEIDTKGGFDWKQEAEKLIKEIESYEE